MPTNKTIREEFEERFKETQCNCVIEGHKKNEFCPSRTIDYSFTTDELLSFIEKALLNQLSEIEDMVEGMPQVEDCEMNDHLSRASVLRALKDKKDNLKDN